MIPAKLTPEDMILIEGLRELREKSKREAIRCEEEKKMHLRVARNLSDQKIGEKFGVSRTCISRHFAHSKE